MVEMILSLSMRRIDEVASKDSQESFATQILSALTTALTIVILTASRSQVLEHVNHALILKVFAKTKLSTPNTD